MSGVKYSAVVENTRALVRVVKVDAIVPIKKADFVELAKVGGWQCVVKKGEFQEGGLALYVEIDSLLPITNPLWSFLGERSEGQKTFDGVVYSRIRTVKLRGEVSQGLLIPVPPEFAKEKVGTNLTNRLGVRKLEEQVLNTDGFDGRLNREGEVSWYERFVRWVAGKPAESPFRAWPSQLSKSDQERVQNIGHHFAAASQEGELFEETVKADGQSMTVYSINDMDEAGPIRRYGVCSRNFDMSLEDIHLTWEQTIRRFLAQNMLAFTGGFSGIYRTTKHFVGQASQRKISPMEALKEILFKRYFWYAGFKRVIRAKDDNCVRYALNNQLLDKLATYNKANGDSITVQGELFGPGIQKNHEQVGNTRYVVYQVYRNGKLWVAPKEAREIVKAMGMEYIHVLNEETVLPATLKEVLARAKGKGVYAEIHGEHETVPEVKREGIVFKSTTRDFSFKAISNEYLLQKEKETDAEEATAE